MLTETRTRLETEFQILETIDRRRTEENSPGVGWAVEQALISAHLRELQAECLESSLIGIEEADEPKPASMLSFAECRQIARRILGGAR